MKRITAFVLSLIFMLGGMVSCKEEKSDDEKNKEMNALTNFPLSVNMESKIGEEFNADEYPVIGNTKYTLQYNRLLFETLLYSEEGRALSSHKNYPRKSYSKDELEANIKNGSIDIAFIEMTKDEYAFDENLDYTLIGIFPVVFLTSYRNPVNSIQGDVLDDMLLNDKIDSWSDLGGNNGEIKYMYDTDTSNYYTTALNRILYSEKNELKVDLQDKYDVTRMPEDEYVPFYHEVSSDYGDGSYCLTVDNPFFVLCSMFDGTDTVKPVYIDGIKPTYESVKNGEYPYTLYTYAVTRKGEESENIKCLMD